jgi:hypothetical protein
MPRGWYAVPAAFQRKYFLSTLAALDGRRPSATACAWHSSKLRPDALASVRIQPESTSASTNNPNNKVRMPTSPNEAA